jgi:hypothetical protein
MLAKAEPGLTRWAPAPGLDFALRIRSDLDVSSLVRWSWNRRDGVAVWKTRNSVLTQTSSTREASKREGETKMNRNRINSIMIGAVALVMLAFVTPSQAQLHDFDASLTGSNGSDVTASGVGSGSSCNCSECFFLDTYSSANAPAVYANSSGTLINGTPYVITIAGTYNVWNKIYWVAPGQGSVAATPMFSSSGGQNWAAFADWEYVFAYYKPTPPLNLPIHVVFQGISVDGGVSYVDLTPVAGQVYASNHTYQYLVVGQGKQAFFRKIDSPSNDNGGQFKICVQKLVACGSTSNY